MSENIDEADPRQRRRSQLVHRIGVLLFLVAIAAALAGLLGNGPLSRRSTQSADRRITVEHQRYVRHQAPVDLKIYIAPELTLAGTVKLKLSRNFLEKTEVQRVDPRPDSIRAGPKYFTHRLRVQTNAPTRFTVRFEPRHMGSLAFEVAIDDGPPVELRHFAFP